MSTRPGTQAVAAAVAAILLGESPLIRRLREQIVRVATHDFAVLIEGETGSGKELVASCVHTVSGRQGEFVAFNVHAVGESMFDDALFGHVRGAFTGASDSTPGYLAEANHGTLFLDEIAGLPLAHQAKLLRAIELKVFRPVGGKKNERSDFRVVGATNVPVRELVATGVLRADLAERLSGMVLNVPPLRSRPDDILLLARRFLRATREGESRDFAADACALLVAYHWPGNVRQLANIVEASAALCDDVLIPASVIATRIPMLSATRVERGSREARRIGETLAAYDTAGGDAVLTDVTPGNLIQELCWSSSRRADA